VSMCEVNYTRLAEEATMIGTWLLQPFLQPESIPTSMDLSSLVTRYVALSESLTAIATSPNTTTAWSAAVMNALTTWTSEDMWRGMADRIVEQITPADAMDYTDYVVILEEFIKTEAGQFLSTPVYIINNILSLLAHNVNVSSIELAAAFPDSPELQKLASLAEHLPDVLEILLYSYETPQFGMLVRMNFTEAMISLCHPLHNVTDYLIVPQRQTLASVNSLREQFCVVDFMAIEAEYEVLAAKVQDENGAVNLTATVVLIASLQEKWSEEQLSLDWKLANESVWLQVFSMYYYSMQGQTQRVAANSVLQSLELMKMAFGEDAYFLAVKFMEMSLDSFTLLQQENMTLYDLLMHQPLLAQIVEASLQYSPDLLEALSNALLTDPMKLMPLFGDGTAESFIANTCSVTEAQLADIFLLDNATADNIKALQDVMCAVARNNQSMAILTQELIALTSIGPYYQLLATYMATGFEMCYGQA